MTPGLTREQVLQFIQTHERKLTPVPCPELGGTMYVRLMNGSERDTFEQSVIDAKTLSGSAREKWRARCVAYSAVNEAGELLFGEADLDALQALPWTVLDRLCDASVLLNKVTDKSIEDLAKN